MRRNLSFLDKKDLSSHISSWSKEWLFKICKVISRHLPWPWTMYPILLSSSFRALEGLGPAYLSELSSSSPGAVCSPLCGSESTRCAAEPPSSALRFTTHTLHLLFPQPQMPLSSDDRAPPPPGLFSSAFWARLMCHLLRALLSWPPCPLTLTGWVASTLIPL